MSKIKKIFTNVRVIIILVLLVLAIVAINPKPGSEGVAIRSIMTNSSAALAGIAQPAPSASLTDREIIVEVNTIPVSSVDEYYAAIANIGPNESVRLKTAQQRVYHLRTKPIYEVTVLDETVEQVVQVVEYVNETINGTIETTEIVVNKTIEVPKVKEEIIGVEDLGLRLFNAPSTNIRKGLDLQGGTRVLLQPEFALSPIDLDSLISSLEERLNVYGLSDLVVRDASDLTGNQFIVVEIAGANEEEIQTLLGEQGKFEAVIANQSVFVGGQDIVFVCRSPTCAGIDSCGVSGSEHVCTFSFAITVTPDAAAKQADATRNLNVIESAQGSYLSSPIELWLDDTLVDQLNIASGLRGSPTTEISISGSGVGFSQEEAALNALNDMKRLQTIMITGSLPVKLEIVKIDAVSPLLGEEFLKNAILVGLIALVSVGVSIFVRYRKLEVAVPIVLTSVSEVVLLLGVAAIIGWNIDLAAVAGIIIAVGTGVDHQIVIADESLRGKKQAFGWKDRIKSAFFIITASYFTVVVAMLPLLGAGAGLLKGFALTTIIGASIGVFISRPVFAALIEILLKE